MKLFVSHSKLRGVPQNQAAGLYIGLHDIKLNAGQLVVSQQQSLYLFGVIDSPAQPVNNCLFFYPFDPVVDGSQNTPFGNHDQTFQDRLRTVMTAVEDRTFVIFYESLLTGPTLVMLCAFGMQCGRGNGEGTAGAHP